MPQLLARHHFTRPFEEQRQDLEGLFAQADAHSSLMKLSGCEVDLEIAESNESGRAHWLPTRIRNTNLKRLPREVNCVKVQRG